MPPKIMKGNTVFLDLGGVVASATINIDRALFTIIDKWTVTGRAGIGIDPIPQKFRTLAIPIGLNFFKGASSHHRELGIHLSYREGMQYIVRARDKYDVARGIYFSPTVGYRFQKPEGGVFLRIQYTPMIKVYEFTGERIFRERIGKYRHMFGLSAGYFFPSKN